MNSILYKKKKIAYKESGKGTPVLFIHGFCEDAQMWNSFVEPFEGYRIIQMDLSGFGESFLLQEHSLVAMASAVKALLDALNIQKCILIGHSMGGYVGLEFAAQYQGRLLGLGLFHSHPYTDTEEVKERRLKSIKFIQRNGHIHFVKQLVPNLFSEEYNNEFIKNRLIFRASKLAPECIIAATEAMLNRNDHTQTLEDIDYPVLLIIGKKDYAIPYEWSEKMMQLPKVAQIEILPKVGHMGMFEAKRVTQKMVKNFLKFVINHNR